MRTIVLSVAALFSTTALAAPNSAKVPVAKTPEVVPDANAPKGKLPGTVTPNAYRLDFTILPEADRFSGHDEIDVTLSQPAKSIYMHGRDLDVASVVAMVNGRAVPGKWTQVDKTGTARLDFPRSIPGGKATLKFDYSGAFGDSASGLFHVKVGDKWYSWTQFESIDARAAYPGFDEPGFKTPFTVSVTTHPGYVVVGNAPEVSVTKLAGGLEKHQLDVTKPLPTYLVAIDTGPFAHKTGTIATNAERSTPMPYGAVATQAQADKMGYVMAETPRIVSLLENYFGEPFPFPKLDQIGTPIMPGAMENAGADTYGDDIIYLRPGATTGDKQEFGMVVAHELSHQWFGDLVTPAWWDDIWLNESFANWMGYRIGNEWRPELNIGVGALGEGFSAMNTDALVVGRPIHQAITQNSEIDSAFDGITYGKGGQVVAMIAAYLGDEKFKQGVRLHLRRHAYGNATSEQFFGAIADAAHDPKVLTAFKSLRRPAGRARRRHSPRRIEACCYAIALRIPRQQPAARAVDDPLLHPRRPREIVQSPRPESDDPRRAGAGRDRSECRRHWLLQVRSFARGLECADRSIGAAATRRSSCDHRQPVGLVPFRQSPRAGC